MIRPIVFAAGLGTRMGATKALMAIDHMPALAVVLETIFHAGLSSPLVVLGHDAEAVRTGVDLSRCHVVTNPQPEEGLSGSMRLALDAVQPSLAGASDDTATGILTFHVDMPYVTEETIRALLEAIGEGATLAAPIYEGKRGFPVFFHHQFLKPLSDSLEGDSGGRQFLAQHSNELVLISVDDPGCIFDIDRPSDLRAWKGVHLCATNE